MQAIMEIKKRVSRRISRLLGVMGADHNLEYHLSIIALPSCDSLECFRSLLEWEPLCDHHIFDGRHSFAREKSESVRIRVCVSEDADKVDLTECCGTEWDCGVGCSHSYKSEFTTGSGHLVVDNDSGQ